MKRTIFGKRFSMLSLILVITLILNGQPALVSAQTTCLPLCVVNGQVGIGTKTPIAQRTLQVKGNGPTLALEGVDHSYIEFYPNGPQARKAYMGFAGPGHTFFTFANQNPGGGIDFRTTGGAVNLVSTGLNVGGSTRIYGDGGSLALEGTTHSYMEFYPDGPQARKAYFGFAGPDHSYMSLVNQIPSGNIEFRTSGGDVIITGGKGLTVGGTTTTGLLKITGGDLAEPFEIADADTIQPGMVVAIDPDNPGQMRLANTAYDRTVAGVISGAGGINAGVLMYKDGATASTHPVALTGRVYVYADTDNGAIQPGDLLTTSATPGHAMKVTDHAQAQGAILGKAMSKLDKGTGLVLLLVTLQ